MTMKTQMVINRISLVLLGAVILNHVDKVDSSRNCVEQNVSCQHGTCIDGRCHCDTGYQGVNCTEKSDSSRNCVEQNVSCQHGTCIDGQCHCDAGYQGVKCNEKSGIQGKETSIKRGYSDSGTGNTFYNPSFHYENSLSSETNSLSESIPETVVDHRMPIIFGTSPADHRQHAPTYDQNQSHSAPSIDTLGNSQEL
ncbi:protein delta homolog 2-like isoform X2 [Ptychodera flava]|uniref:protein delta homolog 2-like isoform X2 n=1 Tax=Ptychodera flava TaxID=63121 RepID=UPI00396A6666